MRDSQKIIVKNHLSDNRDIYEPELIISHYDALFEKPEVDSFYGESHFMNFGYWDEHTLDQKQACERLMTELLSFLPERSGRILDVACGQGTSTKFLTRFYPPAMVTGINISEKQLEVARKNVPGSEFKLMDAIALEFPDEYFRNILCVESAFHFNTRKRFIEEAYRVLMPGGRLVLTDILMNEKAEIRRKMRTVENFLKDPEDYRELLAGIGFSGVSVIDATEACWWGHFWHTVNYVHRKFLAREIGEDQMRSGLRLAYQRVPDIEYYLLVAAEK